MHRRTRRRATRRSSGTPAACERAWAALHNPHAGEVIVSAAPGFEFGDLAGRHHSGGGSHGSLRRGDSEVPMLTIGLRAQPQSIVEIAPAVLEHFGVALPAYQHVARACRLSSRTRRGRMVERAAARPRCRRRASARRDGRGSARAVRAGAAAATRLRRRRAADRRRPDDLAAVHGRADREALELRGGERVLDVGTGSGYQAAVLAELGADVDTIERIPELAEQARANLAAAGYERVRRSRRRRLARPPGARTVRRDRGRGRRTRSCLRRCTTSSSRVGASWFPSGGVESSELQVIVRSPEGPGRAAFRALPLRSAAR